MKRKIIEINEKKCNGCGLCIPNCQEGALQIIDGKARLVSDLFCDGLGACMGHCPEGAIEIIEREAEPYDERSVMSILVPQGRNTILAHLAHLRDHNEKELLQQAEDYLKSNNIDMNIEKDAGQTTANCGCQGSATRDFRSGQDKPESEDYAPVKVPSELRQWPVQLHLLNPQANYFENADVVLAADCAAFAMGDFHARFMKEKTIAIACPKLDSNKEAYIEKLTTMIRDTKINSLNVVMMEVPCCGGLLQMTRMARESAASNIPIKRTIISIRGEVIDEELV